MTITPELAVSQESMEGPQSAGAHAAPPDAPTRRPAPARRGRSLLVLGLVVLALVAAGTATGVTLHRHDRRAAGPVANQRPGKLPVAVASAPPTVVAADGSTVTCPTGAVPAIALSGGVFTP